MRKLKLLKILKTAKKGVGSKEHETPTPFKSLVNSLSSSSSENNTNTISCLLSSLTSHQLNSFLCDPSVNTLDCFRIFNLVLHYHNHLSFYPDIHPHFTLFCRLIRSRMFSHAELLLHNFILAPNSSYPFQDFIIWVENYCNQSKIITKLLNMLLKIYSDKGIFHMVDTVFQYMVNNQILRDEKTCTLHLYALVKSDNLHLALQFFSRMLDSGMEVSVFSFTTLVSGLCQLGELKMARQLVETMPTKGVKPNVITFNTLLHACMTRWEFPELDMVLCFMEKEGIHFNHTSYKLLIEGYSAFNKLDQANKLLFEMQDKGFEGQSYLYDMIIRGYCRLGNMSSGVELLRIMQEKELTPCDDIYGSLICGMCKDGDMGVVKELVNEVLNDRRELDDVVVHVLETAYQKHGMIHELQQLKYMVKLMCLAGHDSCQDSDVLETRS